MSGRFAAELMAGRFRWDLLCPFPEQPAEDAAATARVEREIEAFVARQVDPAATELDPLLPQAFYDELRRSPYLRLQLRPDGLGLSDYATFRAVTAAMRRSLPAGWVIGTHAGIGLPGLLAALPAGPHHDLVRRRMADGVISGWADTESMGAANDRPRTVATPVAGGAAYTLTGRKVFTSNGAVADELIVTAAIPPAAGGGIALFLVDTRTPGVDVGPVQQLIGLRGAPVAPIRFDRVRVPTERLLTSPAGDWREVPLIEPISALGRMYLVSAAAMVIAEASLDCQFDFIGRRSVNGRELGRYPAVQALLAQSAADVFAMDTTVRWCLLGAHGANLTARHDDRRLAKNVNSLACWRIVDSTMSLLAAEGAETAHSKANRSAPALPVERLLRDARVLRITGGVDFAVDLWMVESLISRGEPSVEVAEPDVRSGHLSARNRDHLVEVARQTRELAEARIRLTRAHPDVAELLEQQPALIAIGGAARELFTMAIVLARVATRNADEYFQALADTYCTAARHRLQLSPPDPAPLAAAVLAGRSR